MIRKRRNIDREPDKKWVCEKCHKRVAFLYFKGHQHICSECMMEVNKNAKT